MGTRLVFGAALAAAVLIAACASAPDLDPVTAGLCGNGIVDGHEACDPGVDPAGCTSRCIPTLCGNGHVDAPYEECDPGRVGVVVLNCNLDCTLSRCGDGKLNPLAEQCDDGNDVAGDGCSSTCRLESNGPQGPVVVP